MENQLLARSLEEQPKLELVFRAFRPPEAPKYRGFPRNDGVVRNPDLKPRFKKGSKR